MASFISDRHEKYESCYDFTILGRVPIIIRASIKNYKKLTQRLELPFSENFLDVMVQTMLYSITDISDAIFGYYQNDEITFILRNDKDYEYISWYGNNIQKLSSVVASLVTLGFYRSSAIFGDDLNLVGNAVFNVKTFAVPSVVEAFNNLIWRQSLCMKNAINIVSLTELTDKLGKGPASVLLKDKDYKEKAELLLEHCGKDIAEDYDFSFLRGVAVYKVPVIVSTRDGTASRNKWYIDKKLPNFVENKDFILNILNNGLDIFRSPDVLNNI